MIGGPLATLNLMNDVRLKTQPRRFGFLYENVVMRPAMADEVSQALDAQPVQVAMPMLETERRAASSFSLHRLSFPEGVASGRLSMPTATTPAMDENGRPARKSSRGKISPDAHARWLADSRQLAPWHYKRDAMMQDDTGRLAIPPPKVKEQLHDMPANYTAVDGMDDRTRHRLIGKRLGLGWRITPLVDAGVRLNRQEWLCEHMGNATEYLGPPPKTSWTPPVFGLDEEQHWTAPWTMEMPRLEPALERLLRVRQHWRHDLGRIRQDAHSSASHTPPPQSGGLPRRLEPQGRLENGFNMIGEVRRGQVGENGTTTAIATLAYHH